MRNPLPALSAMVATLALAACGSTASGGSNDDATAAGEAAADDFPTERIEFIIPYDAGGGSDVTARLVARIIEPELGVTVTPTNLPGGSGAIGLAKLHEAEPDGYTMMVITSSLSALKPIGTSEFGSEDFDTVATIQAEPYGIAVPADSPHETFDDLVAAGEDSPLNVGTTAVGGNNFLAATLVNDAVGNVFSLVPYDGGAAGAVTDTAGGTLDATFASPTELRAQLDAGNIRVLAITAEEPLEEAMPGVPTFTEVGYDIVFETVRVILVPKGTPPERIEVLESAMRTAVEDPEFQEAMVSGGSAPRFLDAEQTREAVTEQDEVYLQLLTDAGLVEP